MYSVRLSGIETKTIGGVEVVSGETTKVEAVR
jgi:hypothetical protein